MTLAASAVPACLAASAVNATVNPDIGLSASKTAGKSMSVDDSASGTLPEDGAKQITFTIETEYDQKFTYGLGISTNESPYWTEHNSKGGWDSKGAGFEISLKKGTNTITVDLSDIDVKPGGEYQFRCYYSAHYDNSVGDMVDNPVTLHPDEFTEDAPINSDKFRYADY